MHDDPGSSGERMCRRAGAIAYYYIDTEGDRVKQRGVPGAVMACPECKMPVAIDQYGRLVHHYAKRQL